MIYQITLIIAAIFLSSPLWANNPSPCEGKLPWKVPADPDGSGSGVSEILVVLNKEKALETVICHCDGKENSYVTVVNSSNTQTRLHLNACVLVTDREIKLHNANSQPAYGGFSKYPSQAKPK